MDNKHTDMSEDLFPQVEQTHDYSSAFGADETLDSNTSPQKATDIKKRVSEFIKQINITDIKDRVGPLLRRNLLIILILLAIIVPSILQLKARYFPAAQPERALANTQIEPSIEGTTALATRTDTTSQTRVETPQNAQPEQGVEEASNMIEALPRVPIQSLNDESAIPGFTMGRDNPIANNNLNQDDTNLNSGALSAQIEDLEARLERFETSLAAVDELEQLVNSLQQTLVSVNQNPGLNNDTINQLNANMARLEQQFDVLARSMMQSRLGTQGLGQVPVGADDGGQDFVVHAMIPGRAWLRNSAGALLSVRPGDDIPGYGRVAMIDPRTGSVVLDNRIVFNQG